MRIAIASGKGGTGKTFITVNLARSLAQPVTVLDCDVEEPNCNLFLNGDFVSGQRCPVMIPKLIGQRCDGCAICAQACEFNAIAMIAKKPLVFEDLCHACGACTTLCPRDALSEVPREIGTVTIRQSKEVRLVEGLLDVGVALAVPLIRKVKALGFEQEEAHVLLDAPPGTSCPMVWTIGDCDAVVLVAEPTAFGLHDMRLAVDTVREVGVPLGVVINKDGLGDDRVERYCVDRSIPILAKVPFDPVIAQTYAQGAIAVDKLAGYRTLFTDLWTAIRHVADTGRPAHEYQR